MRACVYSAYMSEYNLYECQDKRLRVTGKKVILILEDFIKFIQYNRRRIVKVVEYRVYKAEYTHKVGIREVECKNKVEDIRRKKIRNSPIS